MCAPHPLLLTVEPMTTLESRIRKHLSDLDEAKAAVAELEGLLTHESRRYARRLGMAGTPRVEQLRQMVARPQ